MTQVHADRDHATWSASASHRNFICAGALALTMDLPETTSEAADWGTACHQLAEKCLRGKGPADRYIGTTEKGKVYSFEVDEEMAETAQSYVDYVVGLIDSDSDPDARLSVEQKFSLASLKPPFDAGGTADAVVYFPSQKRLEVVDLKTGRGVVVDAKGNPQLKTYALGAMLANKGLDVDHITVTIVQTRAAHKDGRIRSETFHIADLVEWTSDMMAAMHRAAVALADREKIGKAGSEADWGRIYLQAGPHCSDTFCKARATCPALKQSVEDQVGVWFDELDQPRLANAPDSGDPDQRAQRLDSLDLIEDWVKEVRAHEHRLAEAGNPATGYVLVPKQGREKWNEGADLKVIAAAKAAGLPAEKYLNPGKLRTPKQVRKELGSKANLVSDLSSTPSTGTNLVKASQTTRTPVPAKAERYFEPQSE